RLDAGGYHHGGTTVPDHVIDLPPQRRLVDCQVCGERRERRDDQARLALLGHGDLPGRPFAGTRIARSRATGGGNPCSRSRKERFRGWRVEWMPAAPTPPPPRARSGPAPVTPGLFFAP